MASVFYSQLIVDREAKYGWAVALIVIFCILVVIAVAVWLVVWLINRSQDKRQKRLLASQQEISPSPSQVNNKLSNSLPDIFA